MYLSALLLQFNFTLNDEQNEKDFMCLNTAITFFAN
jgi:hypothetical protein